MTRDWLVLVLAIGLAACVDPSVTSCANARVCPATLACDETHGLCVDASQLTSCNGKMEGEPCDLTEGRTGECNANVCIEQVCGDGVVTGTEECEGTPSADCMSLGYYDSGPLGCTARCVFDTNACTGFCGDDTVNGPAGAEVCDGSTEAIGSCLDYGFEAGPLSCGSFCAPDLTRCRNTGFVPFLTTAGNTLTGAYVSGPGHIIVAEANTLTHVDGATITKYSVPMIAYGMWGTSTTDIHAVGRDGIVAHFDGTAWTVTRPGSSPSPNLWGVWGSAANDIYAVGYYYGATEIVHFNGSSWQTVDTTNGQWNDVWGATASNIRAVGNNGKIRKYNGSWSDEDASACWSTVPNLTGIWGSGPSDVFIVGTGGTICHFNGSAWSRQWTGTSDAFASVWGRGPSDVFAVGAGGVIYHYDGAEWWPLDSGTLSDLATVHGSGSEVVAVGAFGAARRYSGAGIGVSEFTDPRTYFHVSAGTGASVYAIAIGSVWQRKATVDTTWTEVVPNDFSTEYTSLWVAPDNTAFVVDTFNAVHTSTSGFAAQPLPTPGGPTGIVGRTATDVYTFNSDGPIAHYNGTWSTVASSTLPFGTMLVGFALSPTTAYATGYQGFDGKVYKLVVNSWVSLDPPVGTGRLQGAYAASDSDVFVVGDKGVILHYDGTTWTTLDSGVANNLLDIDGTGKDDVFAVGNGVVLHYDGTSWSPVLFPSNTLYVDVDVYGSTVLALTDYNDPRRKVVQLIRDPGW